MNSVDRNRRSTRRAGLAAGLLGFAALAALPPTVVANPDERPPRLDTPYSDEAAGRKAAEQAAAMIGLVDDPKLVAYVDAVGQRLARHAPGYGFDYRFQIVDDDTPNAFALPGGYIFVSRGLLALSNSEDELAGVLGHEIAHVGLRHAAARQQVGGSSFAEFLQAPALAAYSRDLERSADRVGQGLSGVSGYDPGGIAQFLQSLNAQQQTQTVGRIPGFLATHPSTRGRAADASQRAAGITWKPQTGIAPDREAFLQLLDGLVVGASGAQGVFDGQRFLHADLGFTLRFPDGWTLRNTTQAVGAISPDRRAPVLLEGGSAGNDAAEAAAAWIQEGAAQGLRVRSSQPVKLRGRVAQRVIGWVSGGGRMGVMATFVPWRDRVYRIIGISVSPERFEPLFVSTVRSFRPMSRELLARVYETRLRIVRAQPGETVEAVSKRLGNEIPVLQTAVLNGVRSDHRFAGGEPVKIGLKEAYRPRAAEAAGEAGS